VYGRKHGFTTLRILGCNPFFFNGLGLGLGFRFKGKGIGLGLGLRVRVRGQDLGFRGLEV
jgi:hypothetical protein